MDKTVVKKPLFQQYDSPVSAAAAILIPETPQSSSGVSVAAALQVEPIKRPQHITPTNAEYWALLFLPPNFHEYPHFLQSMPEPFNPIPPHPHEIDMLFVLQPDGTEKIDYVAMHALLYDLVHPGVQATTSYLGQTVHHTFINLAVIPDFLLEDDHALQILQLK